jgi:hypothetical protein
MLEKRGSLKWGPRLILFFKNISDEKSFYNYCEFVFCDDISMHVDGL